LELKLKRKTLAFLDPASDLTFFKPKINKEDVSHTEILFHLTNGSGQRYLFKMGRFGIELKVINQSGFYRIFPVVYDKGSDPWGKILALDPSYPSIIFTEQVAYLGAGLMGGGCGVSMESRMPIMNPMDTKETRSNLERWLEFNMSENFFGSYKWSILFPYVKIDEAPDFQWDNLRDILKEPNPFLPHSKVGETIAESCFLFFLPSYLKCAPSTECALFHPLTINLFRQIFKNKEQISQHSTGKINRIDSNLNPRNRNYKDLLDMWAKDSQEEFLHKGLQSHWVLMHKEFCPGSLNENYTEQKKLLPTAYPKFRILRSLEAVAGLLLFSLFHETGRELLGKEFSYLTSSNLLPFFRTKDKTSFGSHVNVGGFDEKKGLVINGLYGDSKSPWIGTGVAFI